MTIYNNWGSEVRTALSRAFIEKFGIQVEFVVFSRSEESVVKIQMEKRAGMYIADLFSGAGPTQVVVMKQAGLLGQIEPLLILPEVTDPRVWTGGTLPFVDKDKQVIAMSVVMQRSVMYNTDLIKKGELTSYRDLLKPQYKGRMTMNDPTVAGNGLSWMAFLARRVWGLEEASDFLTQLVKQQEVVILRDQRLQVESVARGKFAIGLAAGTASFAEFVSVGAPLDAAIVKEGAYSLAGSGGFAVPNKFAHPHAARIFVNWLLTREGQTVFARIFGSPSTRSDVSREGINPIFVSQPGEKLFFDDEEMMTFRSETMARVSREIIDKAMKK